MADPARVTVTIPADLLRDIDRREKNRSKFVAEAVRAELNRRRRAEFELSLHNPHPDSEALAEAGFAEWAQSLPQEKASDLVDMRQAKPVRWVAGKGWAAGKK